MRNIKGANLIEAAAETAIAKNDKEQ